MRRILLVLVVAAAALAVYWLYRAETDGISIYLTEAQLQQQLETKFPIERSLLLAKAVFSDPKVQLKEGTNRIHLSADAVAIVPTQPEWKGSAEFSGGVRYDPEQGAILLEDARIENLVLAGVPEKYHAPVKELGTVVAREYLNRVPIYKLDPADYRQSVALFVLKSVSVENGRLRIVLGV